MAITWTVDYPGLLLAQARDMIVHHGTFGPAIVVAHMACEVAVQHALTAAFTKRNIPDLEEPITEFLSGFSLNNDKIRKLYTALTGDAIQDQPWWPRFKASSQRRNAITHDGSRATEAEARESVQAAMDLVNHVQAVANPGDAAESAAIRRLLESFEEPKQ